MSPSVTSVEHVVVLALPGVSSLDLGIATQVLGSEPNYRITVCANGSGNPVSSMGFALNAPAGVSALAHADTVIVPGYSEVEAPVPAEVCTALQSAHARGARLVSICTGVFALAAAQLLDGRPATTHWQYTALLAHKYPRIEVLPDRLYVDDGDILTSAGVTAGIDLCLHIVRRDHGAAAANDRARALVAPPHRTGGQSQFIARFRPDSHGADLAATRDWMLARLAQRHRLDDLAARAHMSRRTFLRRFQQESGTSPIAWLTSARIDLARELLETSTTPVEHIARLSGLGSPAAFRATFHRYVGTSPQQYRATFHDSDPKQPRTDTLPTDFRLGCGGATGSG